MLCYTGCATYNLGTGRGTTVLEIVAAFEKASGKVAYGYLALIWVLEVGVFSSYLRALRYELIMFTL